MFKCPFSHLSPITHGSPCPLACVAHPQRTLCAHVGVAAPSPRCPSHRQEQTFLAASLGAVGLAVGKTAMLPPSVSASASLRVPMSLVPSHLSPCPVQTCPCTIHNPVAQLKRVTLSVDFLATCAGWYQTFQLEACESDTHNGAGKPAQRATRSQRNFRWGQ